jgi:glycosyltransferase involved in cell wall biosynthesis
MSLGMWVVATDAGGVREVLHSYERAILVEPGDSAALREGLERALSGQRPQPLATPPAMG